MAAPPATSRRGAAGPLPAHAPGDDRELDASFETLGNSLLDAQEQYLQAKELDEALFGDDYE